MRLCVPILAKSTEEALRKMDRPYGLPGPIELILELRLDWIRDPDPEKLLRRRPCKLLVTNRRREEGGLFSGTEEERVMILRRAAASGADYVDIEASTGPRLMSGLKKEIARIAGKRPKLVVSWHDFQKTPSERSLRGRLAACGQWSPDIVKIVTMANAEEDNLRILRLIPYARRKGMEVIAFCMGPAGRISRVASVLLGGYLGFAAANGNERSAGGQMPVRDMVKALCILGYDVRGSIPHHERKEESSITPFPIPLRYRRGIGADAGHGEGE